MISVAKITDFLEGRLSKKRFTHSMNVAVEAKKLAKKYDFEDLEKAYLAGLLHDVCKEIPQKEQLELIVKSGIFADKTEISSPPLFHAIAGAVYCRDELSIEDEDFLNAIRYHTVARAKMSKLEEIIYMADLISADRNFKDVDKMRKIAYKNMDKAMLEAIKFSISSVISKKAFIPVCTIEAYNYYNEILKNREDL